MTALYLDCDQMRKMYDTDRIKIESVSIRDGGQVKLRPKGDEKISSERHKRKLAPRDSGTHLAESFQPVWLEDLQVFRVETKTSCSAFSDFREQGLLFSFDIM